MRDSDGEWQDWPCRSTNKRLFVCKPKVNLLTGNKSLVFRFTKEEILFPSFEVWHHYQASNHQLVDSWEATRMTGFRLSWKIENPPLEAITGEVGTDVKTPGLGDTFDRDFFLANHDFLSSLQLAGDLGEKVSSGQLVIHLQVDAREEEGWQEEVVYRQTPRWGKEKYKLYKIWASWAEAEAHSQSEGGQLASVLTEEEQSEILAVADGSTAWTGGSDQQQEGVWQLSDGSAWGYHNWKEGYGKKGTSRNCATIERSGEWYDSGCQWTYFFICELNVQTIRGNSSLTLQYTKDQLTFDSFEVLYSYKFGSEELVNSWKEPRMT